MLIAAAKRMRDLTAHLEQRKQEEQERLDRIIAEFNGDLHKMAGEILRYRHAVTQMADAISWMKKGAPFAIVGPGPHWQQPRTEKDET